MYVVSVWGKAPSAAMQKTFDAVQVEIKQAS
jgi:hypothetical protein